MTRTPIITLALLLAGLLLGCATRRELIENRIRTKTGFFASLPPDKQQQLRDGHLNAGDAQEAAWIVYGKPDRIFQKVTAATTNEVWSYVDYAPAFEDRSRPVFCPVRSRAGRTIWMPETLWENDVYSTALEYLRIEFQDGRVLSFESEKP